MLVNCPNPRKIRWKLSSEARDAVIAHVIADDPSAAIAHIRTFVCFSTYVRVSLKKHQSLQPRRLYLQICAMGSSQHCNTHQDPTCARTWRDGRIDGGVSRIFCAEQLGAVRNLRDRTQLFERHESSRRTTHSCFSMIACIKGVRPSLAWLFKSMLPRSKRTRTILSWTF